MEQPGELSEVSRYKKANNFLDIPFKLVFIKNHYT